MAKKPADNWNTQFVSADTTPRWAQEKNAREQQRFIDAERADYEKELQLKQQFDSEIAGDGLLTEEQYNRLFSKFLQDGGVAYGLKEQADAMREANGKAPDPEQQQLAKEWGEQGGNYPVTQQMQAVGRGKAEQNARTSIADQAAAIEAEGKDQGWIGAMVDSTQSGAQRFGGNILSTAYDKADEYQSDLRNFAQRNKGIAGGIADWLADTYFDNTGDTAEAIRQTGQEWRQRSKANQAASQAAYDRAENYGAVRKFLAQGLLDAAASGVEGAASIPGGPFGGTIAAGGAWMEAYQNAKDAGLSDQDADDWAKSQAIPELVSYLPTGKTGAFLASKTGIGKRLLGKGGAEWAADKFLEKNISTAMATAARATATATGEAGEEAFASLGADLGAAALAGYAESAQLRDFAKQEGASSLDEALAKAGRGARAGFLMGGTLGLPGAVSGAKQANAQWKSDVEDRVQLARQRATETELNQYSPNAINVEEANQHLETPTVPRREQRQPVQEEMFPETTPGEYSTVPERSDEGVPVSQYDANEDTEQLRATRNRIQGRIETEQERIADLEQRQKDAPILEGTGYEVFGKKEEQDLKDSRERLAALERAYNSTLAGNTQQLELPIRERRQPKQKEAKPIQTRGGDTVYQTDGSITSNVRDAATKEADKLLENERKKAEAEAAKNLKTVQQQHADSRKKELERLATDTQSITDMDARRKAVTEGIVSWDKANPKPTSIPEGWTPPQSKKGNRAKPTPTSDKVEIPTRTVPKANEKAAEQQEPARPLGENDQRVKDLLGKLGVEAQEASSKAGPAPNGKKRDPKDDDRKARQLLSSLIENGTDKQAADMLTNIDQGKLIIVPNAASVGLESSSNGAAQFHPARGKMYLFTDNIRNLKNPKGEVIKAVHEATHAGQFNEREGRSTIMQTIMGGKSKSNKAEQIIRDAAKKGNKLAQRAVNAANKVAEARGEAIGNIEVMPYFAGEVAAARQGTLGSLGGIARDMMAGTKAMLKKAGVDMDISYNDLYSAIKDVQHEVARTELKPDPTWRDKIGVEMVYGPTASGFKKALDDGRVVLTETGHEIFVLSDADAEMKVDAASDLLALQPGQAVPAGQIMEHPVLDEQMKKWKNVPVMLAPANAAYLGVYNFSRKHIQLHPEVVDGTSEYTAKEVLMHELQHWVQDENGREAEIHEESPEVAKTKKAAEQATKETDKAARAVVDRAKDVMNSLPAKEKAALFKTVIDTKQSIYQRALAVQEAANNLEVVPSEAQSVLDTFSKAMTTETQAMADHNKAVTENAKKYLNNSLEKEAFFTQAYVNAPQSAIPLDPSKLPGWGTKMFAEGDLARRGKPYQKEMTKENAPDDLGLEMQILPVEPGTRTDGGDYETTKRFMPTWFTNAFLSSRGLHKSHNEIIENSITAPAEWSSRAERIRGQYEDALNSYAAQQGISHKEAVQQLTEALDAADLENKQGWDAKLKAFDDAVAPFGEAGYHLRELRDMVDDLSMSMLEARAEDPAPLSEKEKAQYGAIASNLGAYNHRAYVVNSGDVGKTFAKRMMGDYKAVNDGKKVTEAQIKNHDTVRKALDVIENTLLIPDDMSKVRSDRVDSLYETWVTNRDTALSVDEKRAALDAVRDQVNGDTDRIEQKAEQIARELVNLADSTQPLVTYFRGGKTDKGILQKRQNVPEAVRRLMGEVTDPGMKFLTTVAKQAQFLSQNKMQLELANNLGGDILPPDARNVPKGWTQISGEGLGVLQGHYASPAMHSALNDMRLMQTNIEDALNVASRDPTIAGKVLAGTIQDIWGKAASISKFAQIVINPANFMWNLGGGWATMVLNGNVNPVHLFQAFKDAKAIVAHSVNPRLSSEAVDRLLARDIVDSAFVGEIKAGRHREFTKLADEMAGREGNKNWNIAKNYMHAIGTGGKEMYAMMDVVFKIANFHAETDFLQKYYDAKGETRTQEQIDREAADAVKRTNFTFRRTAPIVKVLEARGLTAFLPYMYEVFRSQVGNFMQARSEYSRGAKEGGEAGAMMKARAIRRWAGHATMLGITGGMSAFLNSLTFGDDEEERKNLRALLGERYGDQDYIKVGEDAQGYPILMQASRLDPYGPATDLLRAITTGEGIEAIPGKLWDTFIAPRLAGQVVELYKAVKDEKRPSREPLLQQAGKNMKETIGRDLYSDFLDLGEGIGFERRTTKAMTNVLENLLGPGIMTSWRNTNNRPAGDDAASQAVRAASFMGFNFMTLNPEKPLKFRSMDFTNETKLVSSKAKEFFDDNPDRSSNEVLGKVTSLRRDQMDAYKEMRKVIAGAMAAGMSEAAIRQELLNARVPRADIATLLSSKAPKSVVSERSLKTSMTNEIKAAKSREEKAEVKERWNSVLKLIREAELATTSNEEDN